MTTHLEPIRPARARALRAQPPRLAMRSRRWKGTLAWLDHLQPVGGTTAALARASRARAGG